MAVEQNGVGANEVSLLRDWFQVGQEVKFSIPETGIVCGFGKTHIPRGGFDHKKAGVYVNFFQLRVKTTKGYQLWNIEQIHGRNAALAEKIAELRVCIGELPDTPFWVGDIVRLTNLAEWRFSGDPSYPLVVKKIYYGELPVCNMEASKENDHYEIPCPGGHFIARTSSLALVSRGNIWKLEHGEPLSFASLNEEGKFYQSLGMSQKVLHTSETRSNDHLWDLWAGIQQLQSGNADQLIVKDKKTQQVVLIKYEPIEFGDRMRAAELARLGC